MKRALFALALAAALPMSAQASELSYSFVELDYVDSSAQIFSAAVYATDGYGIRGSFGFADQFYVSGGYKNTEFKNFSNVNADKWNVGFGYHHSLNDQADWIAELGYTNVSSNESIVDQDYYNVSFGIRGSMTDNFEGTAKLNYNDGANAAYPQYDGSISATVGLKWNITEMWGIVGEIEASEDNTDYTLGVRASF